ncbi:2Fe-2S iron-sulfur cluster-binding protein [Streptomyces sp. NPDC006193]|uniref:2Fe-2S iron-sulfur cluster-binding protein n=1 Tax=Streptomyces sp. NPDC006193 TaxID=3155717 RepID=UPI0033A847D4
MTDDQHGEGTAQGGGRWDPLPQGDYDDGATAFVQLPEGGIDALLAGDSPLAAPGHGYVPPRITATHTDGAADAWSAPDGGGRWPDPNTAPAPGQSADDRYAYQPGTQHWTFQEPPAPAAPGHDVTGQWSIPVAGGEIPEESGEFTTSSLVEQWGGTPPATLPGGAPAPWATDGAGGPWGGPPAQPGAPAPEGYVPQDGYGQAPAGPAEHDRTASGWPEPGHGGEFTHAGHPGEFTGTGHAGGFPQAGHPGEFTEAGHAGGFPQTGRAGEYADAGHAGEFTGGGHTGGGHGAAHLDAGHADGVHADGGYADGGHADAGHAGTGHGDAGHADAGQAAQAGTGHAGGADAEAAEAGHAEAGHAEAGHAEAGHAEAGHAEAGHAEAGHAEAGHTGAGQGDAGHADAGQAAQAGTGHAEDGDADAGQAGHADADAGHAGAVHAEGAGYADTGYSGGGDADAGRAGTEDAGSEPGAVHADAGHARSEDRAGAEPAGDAHDPGGAAERAADGPAGQEQAGEPGAAPQAATEAATAPAEASAGPGEADEASAVPESPADAPTADTPTADAPASGTSAADAPAAEHPSAPDGDGAPEDSAGETAPEGAPDGAGDPEAAVPSAPYDDHPLASYVLRVNGADRPVTDAWIGESLLYVLRERLGLAGAKDGCSQGECGACNVQVDGRLVASCLVPAATTAGSEVRTVEGLAADGRPSDVQRALARCGAVQCGFCVPGMAMTVHDLLEGNPAPTELETRQALCGNLCRCSGYRGVLDAVKEVVAEREASRAGPETDADEARIPHQAGPGAGGVHPSAFEAPGAFDTPRTQQAFQAAPDGHDGYGDTPSGPYGDAPGSYPDARDPYGTPPGAQDGQHYGQDGGQA